jgi:hypothetical protein
LSVLRDFGWDLREVGFDLEGRWEVLAVLLAELVVPVVLVVLALVGVLALVVVLALS